MACLTRRLAVRPSSAPEQPYERNAEEGKAEAQHPQRRFRLAKQNKRRSLHWLRKKRVHRTFDKGGERQAVSQIVHLRQIFLWSTITAIQPAGFTVGVNL